MAATITLLQDFANGQGIGATNYFNYATDLDANFTALEETVNTLVAEVRGVQGPNQVLPLDILQLDDVSGPGVTGQILVGSRSYLPIVVSISQLTIGFGTAIILNARANNSGTVPLSPRLGTLETATWWTYIALDANGAPTINTAPGAGEFDIWRVEVNAGGTEFITPGNIEKVGTWQFGIDGDDWVSLSDSTGIGGDTFPAVQLDSPADRFNRLERLVSGFTTDLQTPAATIGPLVIPGGTEALPGLVLGDGTGTNDLDSGFRRIGADRIGYSAAGVAALEIDAAGQLDLITNFRVKGRRTAAQTLTDASGLVDVVFTAADDFDIGTWHGADADFTVPTDGGGTYVITAAIEWATAITNRRDIRVEIQIGGTLITGGQSSARLEIDEDHASTVTVVVVLAAGNVVTVQASHDDADGALGLDIIDATLSIVKVA
jgi:hypothetical protein